jgi:hypothetical protein
MDARPTARMPLDLTDLELETAAQACRAMAYQEPTYGTATSRPQSFCSLLR